MQSAGALIGLSGVSRIEFDRSLECGEGLRESPGILECFAERAMGITFNGSNSTPRRAVVIATSACPILPANRL